jgi:hypothetical protein
MTRIEPPTTPFRIGYLSTITQYLGSSRTNLLHVCMPPKLVFLSLHHAHDGVVIKKEAQVCLRSCTCAFSSRKINLVFE